MTQAGPERQDGLAPLHPDYRWQLAVHAIVLAILILVGGGIASTVLAATLPSFLPAMVWVPATMLLVLVAGLPLRRYRQWG